MKTTDIILQTINRLPKGYVFTYSDVSLDVNKNEAVIKALNRMVSSGKIAKLSKGKYYKPETTLYGVLQPKQTQIVKDLLGENGKVIGYLTGYSIFNQLLLTTQVSNIIQIGRNQIRSSFKRENFTISFIKQNNIITKENIPLLQILDSIRYIKLIPDTVVEKSCIRFIAIINELSIKEINALSRLALKYQPSTRALLGALLDESGRSEASKLLMKSLNPITKYKFAGASKAISTTSKWNII